MKKVFLLSVSTVLCLFLAFLSVKTSLVATQEVFNPFEEYVSNEVLVKFKKDIGKYFIEQAIDSVQGRIVTHLGKEISTLEWNPDVSSLRSFLLDPDLLHIKVPKEIGTEQAIYFLSLNPNIEYAQKNLIYYAEDVPNDTHFSKLWGLHNTGQTGGKTDADIDAPEAWDIFTGSSNIVVAVIDTGIDYDHEDLAANIWINPGESGGGKETNGIDDDGNGYVDDFRGWNFVGNNNDPMDDNSSGDTYHGTHVAGTIGAVGNNSKGVAGLCWNVKLMAVKFLNIYGSGTTANAIKAIDYSTANGAHISNNSWGSYSYDSGLYSAIGRARAAGKLFIAAAGNDNKNTDQNPHYPSSYPHDNIISVLSTEHNDSKSQFSNYGNNSVDVGAPGGSGYPDYTDYIYEDIYSTKRNNSYRYLWGTSMASPHVAGIAALAWGKLPYPPLIYGQLKARIISKVDYQASLDNKCVSDGRVNAHDVIYDSSAPNAPSSLTATPTGWDLIRLTWQDNSYNEIGFEIQRKKSGEPDFSYLKSFSSPAEDSTATSGITHYYKVRAYNMRGFSSFTDIVSATVPTGSPAAPSNLNAEFMFGAGQVRLAWSDNANNELEFRIERKSEYQPSWQQIDTVGPNVTTYYDSNVQGDTFYYYRVRAYNPSGFSGYSNEVQIYVPSF